MRRSPPLSAAIVVASAVIILWTMAFRFHVFPVAPEFAVLACFCRPRSTGSTTRWKKRRIQLSGNRVRGFGTSAGRRVVCGRSSGLVGANRQRADERADDVWRRYGSGAHMRSKIPRFERNVLALAKLDLAASGMQSGEADRVLAQALERVLTVVGFPAGAILLRQPTARNKKAKSPSPAASRNRCSRRWKTTRCAITWCNSPRDWRGLAVFSRLGRDASWSALEREEMFSGVSARRR